MQLPDGVKMTPMLKQYTEWKAQYPDCLLFFRMGDFYEMFFEDAQIAASVLDITLTARDKEKAIPMAGVPYHSVEAYLGRLIAAGYRVAICDQTTVPDGQALVERRVVRVVTPGTHIPENSDEEGRLAALTLNGDRASLALLSSGTGLLEAGTFSPEQAFSLLSAYSPKELLVPSGQIKEIESLTENREGVMILERERGEFSPRSGTSWLCRHWQIASLRAMGLEDGDPATGAAAAVLRYLEETQFGQASHVVAVRPLHAEGSLILDESTQLNLELVLGNGPTLFSVLNRCHSPMGRRLMRDWILHPLADLSLILERQECVAYLVSHSEERRAIGSGLSGCRDLFRALGRLGLGVGNPRDLSAVRDTLAALPLLNRVVEKAPVNLWMAPLPDVSELGALLSDAMADDVPRSVKDGYVIRHGYDEKLDGYRDLSQNSSEWLTRFEEAERAKTGIRTLKVGVNKVYGYYIEVSKSNIDRVPDSYVRRQTVVGGERYIVEELKNYEKNIFEAERLVIQREEELYHSILERTLAEIVPLQKAAQAIATLDVLVALAEAAREGRYVRPVMDMGRTFDVRGGRHPVVEYTLEGSRSFTPNDVLLNPDKEDCIGILTGPNMAGKSTYLRMAALVALMAHMGSFVPAESAHIGLLDRIFTRIGARDELARGRSTFMVEMLETANILRHVTDRSLVILDEIGRGTSTYDGISIAWAVIEYLQGHSGGRPKVLFATHYHELTQLSELLPRLVNLSMAVDEGPEGIRFLHKVVRRPADRSYGIEVARLAGIPKSVLLRSRELLAEFEQKATEQAAILQCVSSGQLSLFDTEKDGIIEELAAADPDHMTPMQALEFIARLRMKSKKALEKNGH